MLMLSMVAVALGAAGANIGDDNYCDISRVGVPFYCGEGSGDCDNDSQCALGMSCGTNNCRNMEINIRKNRVHLFDAADDCCYRR